MNKIEVYSTNYCPYCTKAKNLLEKKNLEFSEIDVSSDNALREELVKKSGGRQTVPQIFINDQHIGGYDDLHTINVSGELDKLLSKN